MVFIVRALVKSTRDLGSHPQNHWCAQKPWRAGTSAFSSPLSEGSAGQHYWLLGDSLELPVRYERFTSPVSLKTFTTSNSYAVTTQDWYINSSWGWSSKVQKACDHTAKLQEGQMENQTILDSWIWFCCISRQVSLLCPSKDGERRCVNVLLQPISPRESLSSAAQCFSSDGEICRRFGHVVRDKRLCPVPGWPQPLKRQMCARLGWKQLSPGWPPGILNPWRSCLPASPKRQPLGRLWPKGVRVKHQGSVYSLGPSVCARKRVCVPVQGWGLPQPPVSRSWGASPWQR